MTDITWTLRTFNLDELTDYAKNPRSLSKDQFAQLKTSLDKFGMIDKPIINADAAHTVIGGHQRLHVLRAERVKSVECWVPNRELDGREVEELNIRLNKNTGGWDFDILANKWEFADLTDWGFKGYELGIPDDIQKPEDEWNGMPEFEQEDKLAKRTLLVHFYNDDDVQEFAELIEQKITDKTKYVYYPRIEKNDLKSIGYKENES
jgi:hypothetical protein